MPSELQSTAVSAADRQRETSTSMSIHVSTSPKMVEWNDTLTGEQEIIQLMSRVVVVCWRVLRGEPILVCGREAKQNGTQEGHTS